MINSIRNKVLAVANKNNYGYISPQDFNLYCLQAQMDIFEQYFYDKNQFLRQPGNDTTYSDMIDLLDEKIDIFEKYRQTVVLGSNGIATMPDYYRMGELYTNACGKFVEIEKIGQYLF